MRDSENLGEGLKEFWEVKQEIKSWDPVPHILRGFAGVLTAVTGPCSFKAV